MFKVDYDAFTNCLCEWVGFSLVGMQQYPLWVTKF